MPLREWLGFYARHFDTVELNSAFYRLPSIPAFKGWRAQVTADFLFAVKASRFLTHMKKLKDPRDPLRRMLRRSRHPGPTLGPVLFQLARDRAVTKHGRSCRRLGFSGSY